jgi:hypothetical protein
LYGPGDDHVIKNGCMGSARDEQEDVMGEQLHSGALGAGEMLRLAQPTVRRREYELRRGDQVLGGLRFPPGRRSVALAEGTRTGSFVLTARPGWVEARSRPDASVIATVELGRRGSALLRMVDGPALSWRSTGWRNWVIADGDVSLLRFTTAHGLLRSSAQITVQQELPEQAGVFLGLVGGFLAFRKLQAEIDASAAVGGIVAAGSG